MHGFPKYLSTKQDVLNVMQEYPKQTRNFLQELLDTKDVWLLVRKLNDVEIGVEDETHKVVPNDDPETKDVVERYQYEFKEDPNGAPLLIQDNEMRYSAGAGITWFTPIGPISLSYAKPFGDKKGDKTEEVQFQIGSTF